MGQAIATTLGMGAQRETPSTAGRIGLRDFAVVALQLVLLLVLLRQLQRSPSLALRSTPFCRCGCGCPSSPA
jgi:hypothetical protein